MKRTVISEPLQGVDLVNKINDVIKVILIVIQEKGEMS